MGAQLRGYEATGWVFERRFKCTRPERTEDCDYGMIELVQMCVRMSVWSDMSQMLGQAKSSPDFSYYLTYIMANGPLLQSLGLSADVQNTVRSSAVLTLKNFIKASYKTIDDIGKAYIKSSALSCLQDNVTQIRNLAGTVITEIIQRGGVLGWPEVVPELLAVAANERGNASASAQEGAMSALYKVCEDHKKDLNKAYQGSRPLQYIIPRLLGTTSSNTSKVRALALACLNAFIPQKSQILIDSLDALLQRLFEMANDPSDDVRRNVCRSFVLIVDVRPDKVQPHMQGLVEYMTLQQRNTDDPELALEAAEFWLAVSENGKMCVKLEPYLPKIVPVLLECMVYDEESIMLLEGDNEDAEAPDRPEDIAPAFSKRKSGIFSNGQSAKDSKPNIPANSIDLEEGEIEETDPEWGGDQTEESWTLRKCSAATLDVLASNFHETIFAIALPYLKDNLQHQDWPNREAAVLAIGAVAEGCLDSMAPNLPDLIPYLLSLLNDNEPAVRVITCWALGRYSGWACKLDSQAGKTKFFEPMMDGILKKMLDQKKQVQESAASAFANLEEQAGTELIPYCGPIIQTFVECFGKYKDRNMFILYDCVQTLAEKVGPALRQPNLIDLLMPALIGRWGQLVEGSQETFPLLECISYVATALGDAFAPFALPIFSRCIQIIHENLEQYVRSVHNEPIDAPNKDFLITSLDLLSAIIQALDPARGGELVTTSQPRFFDLLMFCMEDPSNDVRQSSYALLGDCAVNLFPKLHPFLPTLMPILIRQLDLHHFEEDDEDSAYNVINNACWSCGEIAIKYKEELAPSVEEIYQNLLGIIRTDIPTSVGENAVIALGRLGINCAQILAPHLAEFAKQFLHVIEPVETNDEKCHAFLGFNRTIAINPQAMESCLLEYFEASAAFKMDRHLTAEQERMVGDSFRQVCTRTAHTLTRILLITHFHRI